MAFLFAIVTAQVFETCKLVQYDALCIVNKPICAVYVDLSPHFLPAICPYASKVTLWSASNLFDS